MSEQRSRARIARSPRPVRLFVYGTLRRARPGVHHPLLRTARFLGTATLGGALYDLGDYPGIVRDPRRRVRGELYELAHDDSAQALRALDEYEGSAFVREPAYVTMPNGKRRMAWAYFLRHPPSPRARHVESGRYDGVPGRAPPTGARRRRAG